MIEYNCGKCQEDMAEAENFILQLIEKYKRELALCKRIPCYSEEDYQRNQGKEAAIYEFLDDLKDYKIKLKDTNLKPIPPPNIETTDGKLW